jgi:hypothetical protein
MKISREGVKKRLGQFWRLWAKPILVVVEV